MRASCGERPLRPQSAWIPDCMWKILEACWHEEPRRRPALESIAATCKTYESLDEWLTPPSSPMQNSSGSSWEEFSYSPRDTELLRPTLPLPGYPAQRGPGCLLDDFQRRYHRVERPPVAAVAGQCPIRRYLNQRPTRLVVVPTSAGPFAQRFGHPN